MSNEGKQHSWAGIIFPVGLALIAIFGFDLWPSCPSKDGDGTVAIAPEGTEQTVAVSATTLYGGATRNITDGAFHFPLGGQPKSCDPHKIDSMIEFGVAMNTCEGLLTWGPKGPADVRNGVAESYDVSPDGKTYTFHLRIAGWSNKDAVIAGDFVWSWERAKDPARGGTYSFLFEEAKIATLAAPDERTFVVTLTEPNGVFLNVVPFQTFCPVHSATVTQFEDAWCQPEHFVGNGPYMPTEAKLDDHITLTKNPNYWDAANVEIETAIAHAWTDAQVAIDCYKKGMCDWTGVSAAIPSAELDTIRDPKDRSRFMVSDVIQYARNANGYIAINTKRPGFDNVLVRRAFDLAIDRVQLEQFITRSGNVPSRNFIPDGLAGYAPRRDPVDADCTKAKELLAQAGYPNGEGFPTYEFLYRTNSPVEQDAANAIANMWKQCLGISVTLSGMPMKLWRPKVLGRDPKLTGPKTYDITMDGWQGDYAHPHTFAALLQCGNAQNDSDFCDTRYDTAIAEGLVAHDLVAMQAAYRRAEDVLAAEMPVLPLSFSPRIHAVRPEWTGIEPNAAVNHPLKFIRRVQ
ncbi:MAG: peptide ABC transporter substrate-binding protein [bacterium]|nr:peptide ABC transporter substrate-binding protein [bacterium]